LKFSEDKLPRPFGRSMAAPIPEVTRTLGISETTYYVLAEARRTDGSSRVRRLRQLEDENRKLKQLVADLTLDKVMRQKVLIEAAPTGGPEGFVRNQRFHLNSPVANSTMCASPVTWRQFDPAPLWPEDRTSCFTCSACFLTQTCALAHRLLKRLLKKHTVWTRRAPLTHCTL